MLMFGRNQHNAAAAKSLQSCPTLCDPIEGSPPASPVPGIVQARTLERVAISFSNAWKWKVKVKSLSRVRLFVTPWTAAYQAPLPSIKNKFLKKKKDFSPNVASSRKLFQSPEWSGFISLLHPYFRRQEPHWFAHHCTLSPSTMSNVL